MKFFQNIKAGFGQWHHNNIISAVVLMSILILFMFWAILYLTINYAFVRYVLGILFIGVIFWFTFKQIKEIYELGKQANK